MPEPWPDERLISEIEMADLSLADLLLRAGIRTVGEACRLSHIDYGDFLGRLLRGPLCGTLPPQRDGQEKRGMCICARPHRGEHEDIWGQRWGDRDAIPDEIDIGDLELPSSLGNRLRDAGLRTAGAVRASPQDVKGVGEKGWARLRAMGLRPDSCGAISPFASPKTWMPERRCALPAHHRGEHRDLRGNRWKEPGSEGHGP